MMFLEYKNDIIIIDAGMLIPDDDMLGVDYCIPDISYLKKNKKKIRGIFITHGHLDHIGAVRHILADLDYPLVYGTPMSIGLMKRMLTEKPEVAKKAKFHFIDIDTELVKA